MRGKPAVQMRTPPPFCTRAMQSLFSHKENDVAKLQSQAQKTRKDVLGKEEKTAAALFFSRCCSASLPLQMQSRARSRQDEKHNTYSFLASVTAVVMAGSLASAWGGKRGMVEWKAKREKETREKL